MFGPAAEPTKNVTQKNTNEDRAAHAYAREMTKFYVKNDVLQGALQIDPLPFNAADILPKYVMIHYTAGSGIQGSIDYLRKKGYSYQILIDRNGDVIQGTPLTKRARHAGRSNWKGLDSLNDHSIGVSLANMGYLDRHGDTYFNLNSHGNLISPKYESDAVARGRHWNGHNGSRSKGWERYTAAQYESLRSVCSALVAAFPSILDVIGHEDVAIGRKPDPGMAFEWDNITDLFPKRETDFGPIYKVTVAEGDALNVRKGPGASWGVAHKLLNDARVHLRSFSYKYVAGRAQKSRWASIAAQNSLMHMGFVSSTFLDKG